MVSIYQPCPDIAQLSMFLQADGQNIQHNLYFYKPTHWDSTTIETLAADAHSAWLSTLGGTYTNQTAFFGVTATDLTSLSGVRAIVRDTTGITGTHTGSNLPNNVAFAVQLGTGSRGRGQQGRIFHGPLVATLTSQDTINSVYADSIVTAWRDFVAAAMTGLTGVTHVVLSRVHGGAKRTNGVGLAVVNIGYSNLLLDNQRDRLPLHKKRKRRTIP